jgi:hypothetical protein
MGVEISDNKEDKEYKLLSTEQEKDWHVLSVEDNNDDRYYFNLFFSPVYFISFDSGLIVNKHIIQNNCCTMCLL